MRLREQQGRSTWGKEEWKALPGESTGVHMLVMVGGEAGRECYECERWDTQGCLCRDREASG